MARDDVAELVGDLDRYANGGEEVSPESVSRAVQRVADVYEETAQPGSLTFVLGVERQVTTTSGFGAHETKVIRACFTIEMRTTGPDVGASAEQVVCDASLPDTVDEVMVPGEDAEILPTQD